MRSQAGVPDAPITGATLALNGIALLVDWFAFPLVFAVIARPFGLGSRYVPFIVTRNWASVIIGAMVAVVHALHLVGVLPTALLPYALLVAIAVSLRFSYLIARIDAPRLDGAGAADRHPRSLAQPLHLVGLRPLFLAGLT